MAEKDIISPKHAMEEAQEEWEDIEEEEEEEKMDWYHTGRGSQQPQRKKFRNDKGHPSSSNSSSKRDHHNKMERQRRTEMDGNYFNLGRAIGAPEKASRVTIVNGAVKKILIQSAMVTSVVLHRRRAQKIEDTFEQIDELHNLGLTEEEFNRRMMELLDQCEAEVEKDGDPDAAWNSVQDEVDCKELEGFGPPALPRSFKDERPYEQAAAESIMQFKRSMKVFTKQKKRQAAIASGEIVEEDDDDDCDDADFGAEGEDDGGAGSDEEDDAREVDDDSDEDCDIPTLINKFMSVKKMAKKEQAEAVGEAGSSQGPLAGTDNGRGKVLAPAVGEPHNYFELDDEEDVLEEEGFIDEEEIFLDEDCEEGDAGYQDEEDCEEEEEDANFQENEDCEEEEDANIQEDEDCDEEEDYEEEEAASYQEEDVVCKEEVVEEQEEENDFNIDVEDGSHDEGIVDDGEVVESEYEDLIAYNAIPYIDSAPSHSESTGQEVVVKSEIDDDDVSD